VIEVRVVDGTTQRVEREKAPEAIGIVTSGGVVVSGFRIAFVAGEQQFVVRSVVPGFAKGKVALLRGVLPLESTRRLERWSCW
jgi:hypothetical protein